VLQRRWCDALAAWVHCQRLNPRRHASDDVSGVDAVVLAAAGGGLWLYLNFLEQVQKVGCSIALSLAEFMFNLVLWSEFVLLLSWFCLCCDFVDACQWSVVSSLPPAIFGGPVGLYLSRTHGVIVFMPTNSFSSLDNCFSYLGMYCRE
jgi:hypothetical protein